VHPVGSYCAVISSIYSNNNNNNKPVYEEGDVTALWNQAVHTDREVTGNKPDIII